MPDSLDLDVDVDWLYRGKRKARAARREQAEPLAQGSEAGSAAGAAGAPSAEARNGTRQRSVSHSVASTSAARPREGAAAPAAPAAAPGAAAGAAAGAAGAVASAKPTGLRRSHSLGEKPKKSLFGSLFSRKPMVEPAAAAPAAAPAATAATARAPDRPAQSTAIPISKSQLASSRHHISQYLKEPNSPEVKDLAPIQHDRVVLNRNLNKAKTPLPIKELSQVKLNRVTFAVDKFETDPPQQIPSRRPKMGNVLVPDDMLSAVPSISQGITTTVQQPPQDGAPAAPQHIASGLSKDSKEYQQALETHKKSLKESQKHQQEAHYAAQRIAAEVAGFKARPAPHDTKNPLARIASRTSASSAAPSAEEEAYDKAFNKVKTLEIDKPIHMHEHHFKDPDAAPSQNDETTTKPQEMMLDVVYTRCCHLREILPIPSTLRQLKEKTAPLQTLKFLNPRPTLIDILSFSDFISIVPIHNVVFDNVSLTPEMFKIVITSLVKSGALEKLSMRNVVTDAEGWKLLCKFLMRNHSVVKLDISQTKIRHDLDIKLYRANMDWPLFINVLQKRSGKPLEELLINGVSFANNLLTFDNLLNAFSCTRNENSRRRKLGIAQSQIESSEQIELLFRWISENDIVGVDLAFNDFQNLTKTIIKELYHRNFDSLEYFTLNSTNIQSVQEAASILRELSKLPRLYFLDLSSLPALFPDIFPYLNKYLPRFPSLKRIHFDSNEWSYKDISLITQILPKCKELLHLSIMNQPQESWAIGTAVFLYDCVKNSPKLINLDFNYENIPEELSSRIAIALVRNAQKSLDSNWQLDEISSQDDLLFDGELISETAENILDKLNDSTKLQQDSRKRYLLKRYWEKMVNVHTNVQKTIDDMFEQRTSKELTLQSKENLLRLIFMENTLANILEIMSKNPYIQELNRTRTFNDDKQSFASGKPVLKHVDSERLLYAKPLNFSNDTDAEQEQESNNSNPHLMTTESGRTIDVTTGRPILTKTSSRSSIFSKKQEEEEGELHKWGFYIQQQRSIYPDTQPNQSGPGDTPGGNTSNLSKLPVDDIRNVEEEPKSSALDQSLSASVSSGGTLLKSPGAAKLIGKIPSGAELREAIIKAKGINSIEDLIQNVSSQRVKLDNIYGMHVESVVDTRQPSSTADSSAKSQMDSNSRLDEGNSFKGSGLSAGSESDDGSMKEEVPNEATNDAVNVDETYDKLLNKLIRVRSNKE